MFTWVTELGDYNVNLGLYHHTYKVLLLFGIEIFRIRFVTKIIDK